MEIILLKIGGFMKNLRYQVKSLNLGKIETHTYGKRIFESAIRKQLINKPVFLGKMGLQGDEQAFKDHGGLDKALCLYPYDYYGYWNGIFERMEEVALFGENVTVVGLTEQKAHIGDVFSFGGAVIQVTEPRNPCYKLAAKYDVPDLVVRMRDTGYTGFLLRVLEEGNVCQQDDLVLLEPHAEQVPVSLVNDVKFFDKFNKEKLEKVLAVDALSTSLRSTLLKQYAK